VFKDYVQRHDILMKISQLVQNLPEGMPDRHELTRIFLAQREKIVL
jgi:hypothetical protein